MVTNEEVRTIIYEQVKDELNKKPLTKEELNNPMRKKKNDELYNAIFCYDEHGNICGYNIQVRLKEKGIYKLRFYIPIIDKSWNRVKKPEDLPDKKIKIGFEGIYQSQNELLKQNDIELAQAMFLDFNVYGVIKLGKGYVAITEPNILYLIIKVRGFKYYGYPINEATKKMDAEKLFV